LVNFRLHRIKTATDRFPEFNIPLPNLPKNYLKWIELARPIVDSKQRNFLTAPFWIDVYNDNHTEIMIVNGRQTFKSTYCTDILLADATSEHGVQVCYVTHDDYSLSAFMTQRLRVGAISMNDILRVYPRHGTGNVGEISLRNNSTLYGVTDHQEMKHIEGLALKSLIIDEGQYVDLEFLPKARQALMMTHGDLKILGVGGESGSEYHRLWLQTDQREWEYDIADWREHLQFDQDGLIIGEYMKNILQGKWIAKAPDNSWYHGYHMPQTIFANIPLTIREAIEKYKIHPSFSIEWQQKNIPKSFYDSHVMGIFYRAKRRPITREMMLRCMDRHYALLTPEEIAWYKETYHDKIKVGFGVDFGSGPSASYTAISIIIYWKNSGRWHLAYIERREQEHQMDQAEYINKLFKRSNADIGVGDLGYGQNQVKWIQDGGANRSTGEIFEGVGIDKFFGCKTLGSDYQKNARLDEGVSDEHGDTVARFTIDNTTEIQSLADLIDSYSTHPTYPNDKNLRKPKFLIPAYEDDRVNFLIDDFTDLTRNDLAKIQDVRTVDPRQHARKQFNHPRDSFVSVMLAKVGIDKDVDWYYISAK